MSSPRHREAGFSLIELLIAMVVTLIVTGAIYGLMAGGQSAFRRQPEMTDRQQNIRIAMNVLEEDLIGAGTGLPYYGQIYTDSDAVGTLNGWPGSPAGVFGPAAQPTRGAGDTSALTDVLEFAKVDERCFQNELCEGGPFVDALAATAVVNEPLLGQTCALVPGRVVFVASDRFALAKRVLAVPAAGTCPAGPTTVASKNGQVSLSAALAPWNVVPAPETSLSGKSGMLYQGQIIRYQVVVGADGLPDLWRSATGRFDNAGVIVNPPAGNWQLVARGIDDFQVEYMNANGAWANRPPAAPPCAISDTSATPPATCTDANKALAVRSVRLTLSSRTFPMGNTPGAPGNVIRGRATTVVTMRSMMAARRVENKGF